MVLEARHDHLLDDDQQVMAAAQQKTGQHRERGMASLAEPALEPDAVALGLIFGLARVAAVTDEGVRRAAAWTLFRTGKGDGLEMGEVVLDSWTEIRYDGHAI